ncbi:MAG: hypothetical protein ABIG39_05020 [Candidatus Micrarchaeota archaeon]
MAKALLFVHSEKIPVRSHKYPHVNLSRSTTIFPMSATEYLTSIGKGKIMTVGLDEGDLEEANERWLKNRILLIRLRGDLYSTRFMDEVDTLRKWAKHGVSEESTGEYNRRLNILRKNARVLRGRLFRTKSVEVLVRIIGSLAKPRFKEDKFDSAFSRMKRVTSPEQERFKENVLDTLMRPMTVDELARKLNMNKSTLRKRMLLLRRSGLVKATTQRLAIGRPRIVYFLTADI